MTIVTKNRTSHIQKSEFMLERFERFFSEIVEDTGLQLDESVLEEIKQLVIDDVTSRKEIEAIKLFDLIIRYTNDKIDQNNPNLTFLSASALRRKIYKEASKNRGYYYKNKYGDYLSLVVKLIEQGIYTEELLKKYTEEEIKFASTFINPEMDKKFNYAGLYLLNNSYLKKGYKGEILELPQERFLTSALYNMQDEDKSKRMDLVKESYWALSNHYVGLATPSLMNSGSPNGTLSSCHIITPDDDLISIMNSIEQTGRFSQNGAGIGGYLGFLRSEGSWIRGYKGRASGILHPSRLYSTLAEYVNQLGARVAGIALYLPVWHYDIFTFLDLRLKTGSQEKRAHSIKTAVCIPDEFMRRLKAKKTWTIFDPYEFKKKMGVEINYLYDKKKLQDGEEPNETDHAFTYWYRKAEENMDIEIKRVVQATDIYKSIFTSRKTSGTPYMYYSDTSARMNPNRHKGMPLGSNLCSEIIQNMKPDEFISEILDENGVVTTKVKGEGLVTCNLSSLVLNNVFVEGVDLQRVADIQFRMLDNVISLNRTAVKQSTHTNNLYRAVGAGAMGLVTLMTDNRIKWETKEASEFTDKVFKEYFKASVKASAKLAQEKGSYPYFEGSDWQTGEYFDIRGLVGEEWDEVKQLAMNGMRNGYIQAIAPTSSNSIVMKASPSIDPLYEVVYREVKSGLNVIVTPPNYNNKTKWYYKSGFEMDEMWAINVIASAQKYVDQAISHNMHLSKSVKASELLRLDMGSWEKGLKTTYYTYTGSYEKADGCIMCEA